MGFKLFVFSNSPAKRQEQEQIYFNRDPFAFLLPMLGTKYQGRLIRFSSRSLTEFKTLDVWGFSAPSLSFSIEHDKCAYLCISGHCKLLRNNNKIPNWINKC